MSRDFVRVHVDTLVLDYRLALGLELLLRTRCIGWVFRFDDTLLGISSLRLFELFKHSSILLDGHDHGTLSVDRFEAEQARVHQVDTDSKDASDDNQPLEHA